MSRVVALAATAWLATWPRVVCAGMPSITYSDVARLRLSTISFFLMGLLLCSLGVYLAWNWLRRDFPRLPVLSFPRACGLVGLWGALFVIVLTMISGARELMTPGAWQRDGWTYVLREERAQAVSDETPPALPENELTARWQRLTALYGALASYALAHDSQFPPQEQLGTVAGELLQLPGPVRFQYIYLPNRTLGEQVHLLAHEPNVHGNEPLALFTNGTVRPLPIAEILRLQESEAGL